MRRRSLPHSCVICIMLLVLIVQVLGSTTISAQEPSGVQPDASPSATVPIRTITGITTPNGIAINPASGHVFVTSRDTNTVVILDEASGTVLGRVPVGQAPWGVAVKPLTDLAYVANFNSAKVTVVRATESGFGVLWDIPLEEGSKPTFVDYNPNTGRAFVAVYGRNTLAVINGETHRLEGTYPTGGNGAWGLAVNPVLNRVYMSHRDSRTLVTMDGANGWQPIAGQTIMACGTFDDEPFGISFNPVNDRLYVAYARGGSVNRVLIYKASQTGLSWQQSIGVSSGGANGGGGLAIHPTTGNVFVTNSQGGTVTVIGSNPDQARGTFLAGVDPFGAAIDPYTGLLFVGNRGTNSVSVYADTFGADPKAPAITLSRPLACQGVQVEVRGTNFPIDTTRASRFIKIRMDGSEVGSAIVGDDGSFKTLVPVPLNEGGNHFIIASNTLARWLQAPATIRTPLWNIPIIFIPGGAGTELIADSKFDYVTCNTDDQVEPGKCPWYLRSKYTYADNDAIWLGAKGITAAFLGESRYYDTLMLDPTGQLPMRDQDKNLPQVRLGGPVMVADGMGQHEDVYAGLISYLGVQGYRADNHMLYLFPYDWRKGPSETDDALMSLIHDALAATGAKKVVIIAHSIGGLVARHYILNHGTQYIDQVITMGTPYLGMPLMAKYLDLGDDMGMGFHLGNIGLGLAPQEVKKMTRNFGGIYQVLPTPDWFKPGPLDTGGSLGYLTQPGPLFRQDPLNYASSIAFLGPRTNGYLMNVTEPVRTLGMGDMSLKTDEYYAQRIIGTELKTVSRIDYLPPLQICWEICLPIVGCKRGCSAPIEINLAWRDMKGDDSVTLHSAMGVNLRPGDDSYYLIPEAPHMKLARDDRVQARIGKMLLGQMCSNKQPVLGEVSAAAEAAAPEDTPATSLVLAGSARLNIYDSQNRHAGPMPDQPELIENLIPGVILESAKGAQIALVTSGGPYTITVAGTAAESGALLRISTLNAGGTAETAAFPGIPITSTTMASLVLPGPGLQPGALQLSYAEGIPQQTIPPNILTGAASADVTPPTGTLALDQPTRLVSIAAKDESGGSGLARILYSFDRPPAEYREYTGPFILPPGVGQVTAVATDRAGNSATIGFAGSIWLPVIRR